MSLSFGEITTKGFNVVRIPFRAVAPLTMREERLMLRQTFALRTLFLSQDLQTRLLHSYEPPIPQKLSDANAHRFSDFPGSLRSRRSSVEETGYRTRNEIIGK